MRGRRSKHRMSSLSLEGLLDGDRISMPQESSVTFKKAAKSLPRDG
jgi:hypothetical protein